LRKLLERSATADLWRHTLAQIPTVFGRLVYLSLLRDPNSGTYRHHGIAMFFGEEETNRTLRTSHVRVFAEWLGFYLEQQKADLDLYLSGLSTDRWTLLDSWQRLKPYTAYVPGSARRFEKKLFLTDLETLLALLRNACNVAAPDPDA